MSSIELSASIPRLLKIVDPKDPLVEDLEAFLLKASSTYYNTGKELVDDAVYDRLELILKQVKPKSKALRIRAPITKKIKTKLPYKMSSLTKMNPAQGNVDKWLAAHTGPKVISDKLDGSSVEIVYEADGSIKAYTGGDGVYGGDISYLVPFMKLPAKKFKNVALRGEALVSRPAFKKYLGVFKNPRAMANGLIITERLSKHVKDLEIVFYTVMSPTMTVSTGFRWLKANGFNTVPFKEVDSLTSDQLSKMLTARKAKSKYDLDGLVISQDVRQVPTLESPDYAVAFKEMQETDVVQTTVKSVEWNISSRGYLIPTVIMEPVDLFGTTVNRASGKNAKLLVEMKIGRGAIVSITKGGEVIPDILSVIKPAKAADLPDEKEFGAYHWDKNGTHLVLDEIHTNETVLFKRIVRFFAAMKIDMLKGSTVQKLILAGHDTILKIVRLDANEIGAAIGSQKNGQTVFQSMVKQFGQANLAQFMDASGAFGRGFGERRVEMIMDHYPDILALVDVDKHQLYEQLSRVYGIGNEMAKLFIEGLPKYLAWSQKFPKHLLKFAAKEAVDVVGAKMHDERVIFTGVRSEELEQWVQSQGGEIVGNGKRATICLVKDLGSQSAKRQAAESVGAQIMTVDSFRKKYVGH